MASCGSTHQQQEQQRSNEYDYLLDYFPLNASELHRFVDIYLRNCNHEVSSSNFDIGRTNQHPEMFLFTLPFELSLLPELTQIVQIAMDNVFVVDNSNTGMTFRSPHRVNSVPESETQHETTKDVVVDAILDDDITDDTTQHTDQQQQPNAHPDLISFLEACVSLCGRRGGYRFLVETLFYSAASCTVAPDDSNNNNHHPNDSTPTIETSNSSNSCWNDHNETSLVVVPISKLSGLLYRLCLICQIISNDTTYTNECDTQHDNTADPNDIRNIWIRIASSSSPQIWDDYFTQHTKNSPLQRAQQEQQQSMNMSEWKHWVQYHIPMAPYALSTVMSYILLQPSSSTHNRSDDNNSNNNNSNNYQSKMMTRMKMLFRLPYVSESSSVFKVNDATTGNNQHVVPFWMKTTVPQRVHPNDDDDDDDSGNNTWTVSSLLPIQFTIMGVGGLWRPIYLSDRDGLSFTIFCDRLVRYVAPTLLVIESTHHEWLGYYTTVPWKMSSRWFTGNSTNPSGSRGTDDHEEVSFLFRLSPSWNIYRPQMDGIVPKRYHQFLNLPSPSRSHYSPNNNNNNNTFCGLAVGGVADNVPRFHITPSLEQCKACAWDSVFESGPLLSTEDRSYFDILNIEVWAVNTTTTDDVANADSVFLRGKEDGEHRASMKEHFRQRCAKVDRTQFVDDFVSGAFDNTLFQHRSQTRGRADFAALDNERRGYYVDGKEPSTRHLGL
jgi:TLD